MARVTRRQSRSTSASPRPTALVVALAGVVAGVVLSASVSASAIDVGGDDTLDGYVTGGSVILDDTFDGSGADRAGAASCPDCRWRYEPYCRTTADPGGWDSCPATVAWCPPGSMRVRLLRWTAAAPWWTLVGSTCVGGGRGPVPVDAVGQALREELLRLLPPVTPTTSPPGATLAGLPTYLRSGQPDQFGPVDLRVLGVAVTLAADPRWRWRLDDGTVLDTDDPGAPWPVGRLTHRFTATGPARVGVTTTWTARFTVAGLGPFPVPDPPVTQTAGTLVDVREARAILVPR